MNAAIFSNGANWLSGGHVIDAVYGAGRRQKIAERTHLHPEIITSDSLYKNRSILQNIDVIFSTWGMFPLSADDLELLPRLKAIFYAAGETSRFRKPLLQRGVIVCSATSANAIPVAEFAFAQTLLAGSGYFLNQRQCVNEESSKLGNNFRGHGNYGGQVAIIGNGTISKLLQKHLAQHELEVVVIPSRKENRTTSLEEAFSTAFAVINLLPDREDNIGILNEVLFERMIDHAVFINVGRGRQVNEGGLVRVMKKRQDLTALLDVQWPEPPRDNSELYTLPNILISAHIAGATGTDLLRLADFMIAEFQRFEKGEPLRGQVSPESL